MNYFFTADHHFGHSNIIKFCNRPFANSREMDETLIQNWNKIIKPRDKVFYLGDFAITHHLYTEKILKRLNGNITLIWGSHDKTTIKKCSQYFDEIIPLKTISINKQYIVLCHYCMRVWDKSHYGSWHLYGHSHGNLPPIGKSWDVGVDNNNFFPLSFDEICGIMGT